jgi:hypothetical protein
MGKRAAAGAFAVLVLAGCGAGTGNGPAPAASRDEFVARANRICREEVSRTERVAALRRLRPPGAARELYAHWLTAERDALDAAKALEGEGQAPEGDPLVPLTIAEGKIAGYARRLGADACAAAPAGRIRP